MQQQENLHLWQKFSCNPKLVLCLLLVQLPALGGFFHLWGNVSEWLANPDGNSSNEVSHAGGHFLDTATSLAKNSVRQTHHNDRNRLIGFRVVIQISQP